MNDGNNAITDQINQITASFQSYTFINFFRTKFQNFKKSEK